MSAGRLRRTRRPAPRRPLGSRRPLGAESEAEVLLGRVASLSAVFESTFATKTGDESTRSAARSDDRAQWRNPSDTKRLLSLLLIRAINIHHCKESNSCPPRPQERLQRQAAANYSARMSVDLPVPGRELCHGIRVVIDRDCHSTVTVTVTITFNDKLIMIECARRSVCDQWVPSLPRCLKTRLWHASARPRVRPLAGVPL